MTNVKSFRPYSRKGSGAVRHIASHKAKPIIYRHELTKSPVFHSENGPLCLPKSADNGYYFRPRTHGGHMKDRITIARRPLKDGVTSLFLDYRVGGQRRRENLHLYLVPEDTQSDRAKNGETMRMAKARRDAREFDLEQAEAGIAVKARPTLVRFADIAGTLIARKGIAASTTATIRHVRDIVERLYPGITVNECDGRWFAAAVSRIADSGFRPNTVHSYATVIRQVIRRAFSDGLVQALPRMDMPKRERSERTFLTFEELNRLDGTPFREDVKDAFMFCCFTGLRISD